MILGIECVVLCALFTIGIRGKMRNPIAALYDYPPKIQERVKSLEEYKDKISTKKDRLSSKLLAAAAVLVIFSLKSGNIITTGSTPAGFLSGKYLGLLSVLWQDSYAGCFHEVKRI